MGKSCWMARLALSDKIFLLVSRLKPTYFNYLKKVHTADKQKMSLILHGAKNRIDAVIREARVKGKHWWYGTVRYGAERYGMVWYGIVRYGMAWYGMVWYGMV